MLKDTKLIKILKSIGQVSVKVASICFEVLMVILMTVAVIGPESALSISNICTVITFMVTLTTVQLAMFSFVRYYAKKTNSDITMYTEGIFKDTWNLINKSAILLRYMAITSIMTMSLVSILAYMVSIGESSTVTALVFGQTVHIGTMPIIFGAMPINDFKNVTLSFGKVILYFQAGRVACDIYQICASNKKREASCKDNG